MASRPNGPSGAQRWLFSLGGGNGDDNPATNLLSQSADGSDPYVYFELSRGDGWGRNIKLDPAGTSRVSVGNELVVNGSAWLAASSGNVDIGTTWPEEELHVGGNIRADGTVQLTQGGFLSANTSGWWPTFGLNFATRNQGGDVFYTPLSPPWAGYRAIRFTPRFVDQVE